MINPCILVSMCPCSCFKFICVLDNHKPVFRSFNVLSFSILYVLGTAWTLGGDEDLLSPCSPDDGMGGAFLNPCHNSPQLYYTTPPKVSSNAFISLLLLLVWPDHCNCVLPIKQPIIQTYRDTSVLSKLTHTYSHSHIHTRTHNTTKMLSLQLVIA